MIVAAGTLDTFTRFSGVISSVLGVVPNEQVIVAP